MHIWQKMLLNHLPIKIWQVQLGFYVTFMLCHQSSTRMSIYLLVPLLNAKNTGAWKGRLKRFFVDLYPEELAKNGTNII